MSEKQKEQLILQEGASRFKGFRAIGGTLSLTSEKIIFRSKAAVGQPTCEVVEIPLVSIAEVNAFQTLNINPNGFTLLLRTGEIENFVVDDRKKWRQSIFNCMQTLAGQ